MNRLGSVLTNVKQFKNISKRTNTMAEWILKERNTNWDDWSDSEIPALQSEDLPNETEEISFMPIISNDLISNNDYYILHKDKFDR